MSLRNIGHALDQRRQLCRSRTSARPPTRNTRGRSLEDGLLQLFTCQQSLLFQSGGGRDETLFFFYVGETKVGG